MIENLRKVKWISDYKYYSEGKEISKAQATITNFNDEEEPKIEKVGIYAEGYFHHWFLEPHFETALIETRTGAMLYLPPSEIIFIDEFDSTNYENLKKLWGQLMIDDKLMDLLEFIDILMKNKLIQMYASDVLKSIENGNLEKILAITEEMFSASTSKKLKAIAEKYKL